MIAAPTITNVSLLICPKCRQQGKREPSACAVTGSGVQGGDFRPPLRYDVWTCAGGHSWREASR